LAAPANLGARQSPRWRPRGTTLQTVFANDELSDVVRPPKGLASALEGLAESFRGLKPAKVILANLLATKPVLPVRNLRRQPAAIRSAFPAEYHRPMPAALATRGRALPDSIRGALAALVAAACAVLLYLPALHFGFVFDDASLLTAAGEPVALGGAIPYRPLRYASYLADWALGGSAFVYHLHNVLLHALVVGLTALLARRLGAPALAAFGGALFVALHPLAVEAAAYVAGRRDLLCVAFGLAALLAGLGGRSAAALALLVCSAASKESGLVFAAPVAAALSFAATSSQELRRGLAATAAATAAAVATMFVYGTVGPWFPEGGMEGLAAAGRVLLHYASGLAGLRVLAPEYPFLFSPEAAALTPMSAAVGVAVALLAASGPMFAALAWRRALRGLANPDTALAFVWTTTTVAALALWGGLHEPGADRHAYLLLPPLGVAGAITLSSAWRWTTRSDSRRRKYVSLHAATSHDRLLHVLRSMTWTSPRPAAASQVALAAVAVTLAVSFAVTSREQMQIWASERSLWSYAARQEGASARAHANMARVLAADGEYALARGHLGAALSSRSDDGLVYAGRAAVRCAEGKRALAQRDVRRAHRAGAPALVEAVARECGLSLRARMRLSTRHGRPVEASGK
jgi:hypothetical protein